MTTDTFRLAIRNKYEALQDLLDQGNMDMDTQWQHINEMWTSTCSEVLGKKKNQQKDCISADTVNKVQVRKESTEGQIWLVYVESSWTYAMFTTRPNDTYLSCKYVPEGVLENKDAQLRYGTKHLAKLGLEEPQKLKIPGVHEAEEITKDRRPTRLKTFDARCPERNKV